MPNTKPVGVAYSDPELVSGTTITGAAISGGTVDNAVIGSSTAAAGTFTTATAANLVSTGDVYIKSATVAATGSSQTDAAQVAGGFTLVSAADDTKGVKLPVAVAGRLCLIKNNTSAKTLKIYPATGDKINGGTATTGSYDIAGLTSTILVAYDDTDWYSIPLVAS